MKPMLFDPPRQEAQIIGRASRFVMLALLNDEIIDCHCPVAGTIGGTVLDGLPCLVSGPYEGRATEYTLEAFSYFHPEDPEHKWIGLNQGAANSYVKFGLEHGWLDNLVKEPVSSIKREQKLGSSRIDFLINDDFWLEVKMPVDNIQLDIPPAIDKRWPMAGNLTKLDRAGRQAIDLTGALQSGQRAAFLTVFAYENDGRWREWPYRKPKNALERSASPSAAAFAAARDAGLEQYRLSLRTMPDRLEFISLEEKSSW